MMDIIVHEFGRFEQTGTGKLSNPAAGYITARPF